MTINYDALVSKIIETAENDGSEFTSRISGFVHDAQYRIHRDLDTYGFVTYTTVTTSAGDPLVARPSAALVFKHLFVVSASRRTQLILRTDEFLNTYWPDRTSAGTPKYYAHWGFGQFLLAPAPSAAVKLEASFINVPTSLSTATSVNWLTEYAPDALFFASMHEATMFMKHYSAAQMWEQKYQGIISNLRKEASRSRRDDNEPHRNPNSDGDA